MKLFFGRVLYVGLDLEHRPCLTLARKPAATSWRHDNSCRLRLWGDCGHDLGWLVGHDEARGNDEPVRIRSDRLALRGCRTSAAAGRDPPRVGDRPARMGRVHRRGALGAGAPQLLVVGAGLMFAPVAHAGALYQGVVPLAVACLASVVLKERLAAIRKIGLSLVLVGAFMIGGVGLASLGGRQSIGHLLFLAAAAMVAGYTVAIRR